MFHGPADRGKPRADYATWSSTGVTQQILSDDSARRTIRAVLTKGTTGQLFVRLKVAF
jgi:hypothetical protein